MPSPSPEMMMATIDAGGDSGNPPPVARNRWNRLLRYRLFYICAGSLLLADVLSKWWIIRTLPFNTYHPSESIPVIEGFFYIVHIGNQGAAWGMFSGYSHFLALFALAALFGIYWFRHTLELHRPVVQFAFGIMVGGIIGNLIDRVVHGHVVDFLDFHLPFSIPYVLVDGRYPAFNVADMGIVCGVFLYLILSFRSPPPNEESGQPAKTARQPDR